MKLRHLLMGLAAALPSLSPAALAQEAWPARTIKLIVPFAPGGNTDTIARLTADRLSKALPATIVVENMLGGSGIVAANATAKAEPDGYTLFVTASPQFGIIPAMQKVAYNPLTDFTPIKNITFNPFVLMVHKSVPAKNVQEFVAWAKPQSGKFTYASGGLGSVGHLTSALFYSKSGIDATPVHYKGNAPAQIDVVAGQLPMIFSNLSDALTQAKNPDVRLIAVSSTKRVVQLPDVGTVAEQGIPGFDTGAWNGLVGPAKMPPAIVARLEKELLTFLRDPATLAKFTELGLEPDTGTSADFAKRIANDIPAWAEIVKIAGVKQQP